MNRKIKILIMTVSLFFVPMSIVARYGSAGCGAGSLLIGSRPGIIQIFATTSNYSFFSQTFGITTGTSNCGGGLLTYDLEQRSYMADNLEGVQLDIAAGKGEKLNNLAYLMGCSADSLETFSSVTQKNYDQIFDENAENSSEYVFYRLKQTVKSDATLATACNRVWL